MDESAQDSKLTRVTDDPLSKSSVPDNNKKEWVKFDDEEKVKSDVQNEKENIIIKTSTVLPNESSHGIENGASKNSDIRYNETKSFKSTGEISQPAIIEVPINNVLSNVELPKRREHQQNEGFNNGDIIVTLLPVNESFPWVVPAKFRPELVPEELMAQGLTLTVEEYVHALEMLVNDYRFTLYNICYKRILMLWIMIAFVVLLALLFSGITGILLFSLGVSWLFLNAMAIFLCMWLKLQLARGLEKCLARVNKLLLRHKIIIALDDRGNISCHKVHLCFIYFEAAQCISYINNFLERREVNGQTVEPGWESRLDIESNDIIIQGNSSTRLSRKQNRGEQIIIRYVSRWAKARIRSYLEVTANDPARHMVQVICPCQFIENHLKYKPTTFCGGCIPNFSNENHIFPY
ncbi:hypothetical protein ACKWTF_004814 [Chironomus riparius]